MVQLAERTKLIKPSVTLAIAAKANKLRAEGMDVVNFSAGEPDFDTPEHIKAAAVEALRKGMTKYTDVKGIEPLREAISEKYRREHDLIYRKDSTTRSTQRCLETTGGQHRVIVELYQPDLGHRPANPLDVFPRMALGNDF